MVSNQGNLYRGHCRNSTEWVVDSRVFRIVGLGIFLENTQMHITLTMNQIPKFSKRETRSQIVVKPMLVTLAVLGLFVFLSACKHKSKAESEPDPFGQKTTQVAAQAEAPLAKIPIREAITVANFFKTLDEIIRQNDTLGDYPLTENLLLRANPWILDTLVNTDYYIQMSRGNFVYDQQKMVVLKPGDTLLIPGPKTAAILLEQMANTWLDLNIPAFEMRIMEGDSILYTIPVRVGKKQKKYLELAGHQVDLRTRTGKGEIIRVNRDPIFLDPVTGKRFKYTKRDDQQTTLMPQIPWLEPSINGVRYGQMIHPTTNPRTLGKAASNGCIGTSEADAWRVYFFAPLGTKLQIRYDLMEIRANGDTLRLEDVYQLRRTGKNAQVIAAASFWPSKTEGICLCDSIF